MVTIHATNQLAVEAATITLKASKVELNGGEVAITASGHCGIKAATVDIN